MVFGVAGPRNGWPPQEAYRGNCWKHWSFLDAKKPPGWAADLVREPFNTQMVEETMLELNILCFLVGQNVESFGVYFGYQVCLL